MSKKAVMIVVTTVLFLVALVVLTAPAAISGLKYFGQVSANAEELPFTGQGVVIVPNPRWVDLDNDSCVVVHGGVLIELSRTDQVEVVFLTEEETGGTMCPNGARFYLPADEFEAMKEGWLSTIEAETARQLWMARVLAHPAENPMILNNRFTGWVRVENPSVRYNTSCVIDGGTMTEVGREGGFILFFYTTDNSFGTLCDNGTLLRLSEEEIAGW